MKLLRDRESIAGLADLTLRTLIENSLRALDGFYDYELHELVTFIVVEPGESVADINAALGFSLHERAPELIEEHPDWFEFVFVISDDGFGIEVFIPKSADVDPELLAWCTGADHE